MTPPREILRVPDKSPLLMRKNRETREKTVYSELKNTKRKLFDDLEDLENWVKTPEIEAEEINIKFFNDNGIEVRPENKDFFIKIYNLLKLKNLTGKNKFLLYGIFNDFDKYKSEKNEKLQKEIGLNLLIKLNNMSAQILQEDLENIAEIKKKIFSQDQKDNFINGLKKNTVLLTSGDSSIPFINSSDISESIVVNNLINNYLYNPGFLNRNEELENKTIQNYINKITGKTQLELNSGTLIFTNADKKMSNDMYSLRINWDYIPKNELDAKRESNLTNIHVSVFFNKAFTVKYSKVIDILKVHVSCNVNDDSLHYGRDFFDYAGVITSKNEPGKSWATITKGPITRKREMLTKFPKTIKLLKEIYIEACDAFDIPASTHFGKKKSESEFKFKSVNKLKSINKDILYLQK